MQSRMKRIGLIGGVSPESTEIYVRAFHRLARTFLGGEHSANFIVTYLDYGEMIGHYRRRDWPSYIARVVEAGEGLERAGADALMIGSNTTHRAASDLAAATNIPVIHILDALAEALKRAGARRPLLLGTIATMAGDYYAPALRERYDGEVLTPAPAAQDEIERIIIDELCLGLVIEKSRRAMVDIIAQSRDADAVILGCTELCLILSSDDAPLPVLDTTALHAEAGMRFALAPAA